MARPRLIPLGGEATENKPRRRPRLIPLATTEEPPPPSPTIDEMSGYFDPGGRASKPTIRTPEIDELVGPETLEPPARLGERGEMPPITREHLRFGLGLTVGAIDKALSLATRALAAPGGGATRAGREAAMEPRTLVRDFERFGLLSESNLPDRLGIGTGERIGWVATMAVNQGGLAAAGINRTLAGMAAISATSIADLRSQADAAGVDVSALDYGREAGLSASLFLLTGGMSRGLDEAKRVLMGTPFTAGLKNVVDNALISTGFAGLNKIQGDPAWKEHYFEDMLAFQTVGAWHSFFPGPTRARTEAGATKQGGLVGRMMNAIGLHGRQRPANLTPEIEADVMARFRESAARESFLNDQVPFAPIETVPSGGGKPAEGAVAEPPLEPRAPVFAEKKVREEHAAWLAGRQAAAEGRGAMEAGARRRADPETERAYERRRQGWYAVQGEAAVRQAASEREATAREKRIARLVAFFGLPLAEAERLGGRRPRTYPADQAAAAAELAREFNVPIDYAKEIARRRVTAAEAQEILASKAEEALLVEAETRGRSVLDETMYRLGLMGKARSKIYEKQMEGFTAEERAWLAENVPVVEDARWAARDLERRTAADVAAMEQEDALRPEPPSPAEQVRRGLVERGVIAGPEPPPPQQARQPPPRKVAGQEELLARRARRELAVEEQRAGQAVAPTRPQGAEPVPAMIGARERMTSARARELDLERAMRQAAPQPPAEPKPEAIQAPPMEPIPERPREPTSTEAQGAMIGAPRDVLLGEVMAGAGPPQRPAIDVPQGPRARQAVGKAGELLGARATKPPPTPPAPTGLSKKEAREVRRAEYVIEQGAERVVRENQDRIERRPRLSKEDMQRTFWSAAPILLAAGSLAAGAASKEDDDGWRKLSQLAGIPGFFLALRGRRMSPELRWWLANEKAVETGVTKPLVGGMIETGGKPKPPEFYDRAAALIAESLPETHRPTRDWSLTQARTFLGTVDGTLKSMGQYGRAAERIGQEIARRHLSTQGHWRNQLQETDVGGLYKNPDSELAKAHVPGKVSSKDRLNAAVDLTIGTAGPDTPKVNYSDLSAKERVSYLNVMRTWFGKTAGTPEEMRAAENIERRLDEMYQHFETRATEDLVDWMPRMTAGGRYRQQPFRDVMYAPPMSVQGPARTKWFAEQTRLYRAIAQEQGVPVGEIAWLFSEAAPTRDAHSFRRSIDELRTRKQSNLDFHRFLETRYGRDWDPMAGVHGYLEGASLRLEQARYYGHDLTLAKTLVDGMVRDGYKREYVEALVNASMLQPTETNYVGDIAAGAAKRVTALAGLKYLGGFALSQITGPAMIGARTGEWKQLVKDLPSAWNLSLQQSRHVPDVVKRFLGPSPYRDFVADTGVVQNELVRALGEIHDWPHQVLAGYLRYGGGIFDRTNRNLAAINGDWYYRKLMADLVSSQRRGDQVGEVRAKKQLRELFEEDAFYETALKGDRITADEFQYLRRAAAQDVAWRSQVRTLSIDMPLAANDPFFRTAYALQSYPRRQTAEIVRQIHTLVADPKQGWLWQRRILGWLAMGGMGAVALEIQHRRRHYEPDDPFWQDAIEAFAYGTGASYYSDLFEAATGGRGNPAVALTGPGGKFAFEHGEAIARARKAGSLTPILRLLSSDVPTLPITILPGVKTPKEQAAEWFPPKKRVTQRPPRTSSRP